MIFTEATPYWNEHIVLCLSLSKLGLPATRTGIVIATEEIISVMNSMNAVMSLAPNSVGALLALDMVRNDRQGIKLFNFTVCKNIAGRIGGSGDTECRCVSRQIQLIKVDPVLKRVVTN
jgi:hypothetical protein